jgi:hypothetical protein
MKQQTYALRTKDGEVTISVKDGFWKMDLFVRKDKKAKLRFLNDPQTIRWAETVRNSILKEGQMLDFIGWLKRPESRRGNFVFNELLRLLGGGDQ